MGTIAMLDGSHAWPDRGEIAALRNDPSFVTDDHQALWDRLEQVNGKLRPVSVELKRGQISFHHWLTFHASSVNASDRPRIALAVHLQDGENRYRAARDKHGQPLMYHHDSFIRRLPGGEPDYADPEICPTIWKSTDETSAK